jgi:hypothetical protein
VENLTGGELLIKDLKITPKTNRVVFFGPGHIHKVEFYEGNRLGVYVNIFKSRIEGKNERSTHYDQVNKL